jgi:competence protein ComGC
MKEVMPGKLFGKDTAVLLVWLWPILIIIFLIYVFILVAIPEIGQISTGFGQIKKINAETKKINDKRIYLSTLDQDELKSKSNLIENGVLSEKNSYLLIKIISRVVAEFGYSVGDYSVSLGDLKEVDQTVAKFDYQKVPVEVAVSGPKDNFLPMVAEIENSLPILSIDDFKMNNSGGVATIKMSISAYYLPNWNQAKLESLSIADLTPNKDESDILTKIEGYKYYGPAAAGFSNRSKDFKSTGRVDPFY